MLWCSEAVAVASPGPARAGETSHPLGLPLLLELPLQPAGHLPPLGGHPGGGSDQADPGHQTLRLGPDAAGGDEPAVLIHLGPEPPLRLLAAGGAALKGHPDLGD